jgi:uncharacterized protein (TIGR02145 family)
MLNSCVKSISGISEVILLVLSVCLFHSCKKDPVIKDDKIRDGAGNVYTSVKIGNQEWLVENLKTTRYRNGDLIGTTSSPTLDITNESSPKYQWAYHGNESNVNAYGRLYTWYTVTDSRNICPTGWHVATAEEWNMLVTFSGGYSVAGGKLKETGTIHWQSPNGGATNETGFTALPGGSRNIDGTFTSIGNFGFWWSFLEYSYSTSSVWIMYLNKENSDVYSDYYAKNYGYSVRCIKDN